MANSRREISNIARIHYRVRYAPARQPDPVVPSSGPASSRNQREGYYVGTWASRHVRRHGKVGIYEGDNPVPLFPPSKPWPDNCWAWLTVSKRAGETLKVRRPRYIAKAKRGAL